MTQKSPLPAVVSQEDLIKKLGPLGFASRLKRLSDRLMRDVGRVYRDIDVHFEPRWFSVTYALTVCSPAPLTSLAAALGLTHPAVNQVANEMTKAGLLESISDPADERRRLLRLSKRGHEVADKLAGVWREIRLATAETLRAADADIIEALGRLEDELDRRDMRARVLDRLGIEAETVRIEDYRPAYKKHFRALNQEWLNKYFTVEPEDEKILNDPNGRVIRRGGSILFALLNEDVVGACALLRHSDDTFELAKMAVTERAQGRGIGRRLGEAVISRARELGGKTLYLETSEKLQTAIHLYRNLGFRDATDSWSSGKCFERCTVKMSLPLANQRRPG
ncbi:MAG TPA: GNAT family N-acetyltransferase [candidate division Zixibacteria bacterium]|nr:GNAT family N-acetyltransferase [candidate division Zixibacteria bacterium]